MTFLLKKKALKKLVSSLTMLTTIVSMSGLMALSSITFAAETIVDGDLIKSNATNEDGTPTYESLDVYIVKLVIAGETTKKFKRLILNPEVYNSYEHLSWDDIKVVSQATMDEYTTSTLVRVDTDVDQKVFAMAPDGDIGAKSWVKLTTAEATSVTNYDADSVYTINAVDGTSYTTVGDITTPAQLTTFYANGTLPNMTPVQTDGLTVALSATTPAAGTLVAKQAVADLAHFNFTGNGTVNTVVLQRVGISANTDLGNIYLFDGNTRITDAGSLNSSSVVTFNSAAGLFTVDGTKTISVRADILESATGTIGVKLNSFTDSATTTSANIAGNISSVVASSMAAVEFGTTTPSGSPAVNAGATNYTVWSNPVTIGTRSVNLHAISFRFIGSAPTDSLENINLFLNGSQIATGGVVNALGNIVFDLGSAPVVLNTGVQTLSVRADIVKGSNRNFQISIQNVADVMVEDSQLTNVFVSAGNIPSSTSAGTITISAGSVSVTVDPTLSGTITGGATGVAIAKYAFKAYGEDMKITSLVVTPTVTSGTPNTTSMNNVTLYADGSQIGTSQNYDATALTYNLGASLIIPAGETVTVEVKADTINATPANYTAGTLTVLLAGVTNNAQGISSSNLTTAPSTAGVTSTALTIGAASGSVSVSTSLNSKNVVANTAATKIGSYVIQAGSTEGIKVTNLQVGLTFGAVATTMVAATVISGSGQIVTATAGISNVAVGDTLTFPAATTAGTGTVTSVDLTAGTFVIGSGTASSGDTTGAITGTTGPMTITNITNLQTSENTTPVNPTAINDFPVDFTLAKSTSKVVDVYADLGSLNAGTVQTTLLITAISSETNTTLTTGTGIASALSGQTMTVAVGTVETPTLAAASMPAQFVVGESSPNVATYNFVASNGDAKITELVFTIGTTTTAISSIAIGAVSAPVVGGVATISGLDITVPVGYAGKNVVVTPTYNAVGLGGQTSNSLVTMTLTLMKYTVGNTTTTDNTVSVAAKDMTLVASKPSVQINTEGRTGLSNVLVKLADITVTADAAGNVKLRELPISVSSTGVVTITTDTDNVTVKDASGTTIPTTNDTFAVAAGGTETTSIVFTTPDDITAGTSKTYSIYATAGTVSGATGTTSLSTKLGVATDFLFDDVNGNVQSIPGNDSTNTNIVNYPDGSSTISN